MRTDRWKQLTRRAGAVTSLRARITLVAVLVVGLTLAGAAAVLVSLLRSNLIDSNTSTAETKAESVGALVSAAPSGKAVSLDQFDDDDEFVQIVDRDGTVVQSTGNVMGEPAVTQRAKDGDQVNVRFAPGQFVVATQDVKTADGPRTVVFASTLDDVRDAGDTLARLLVLGVPILTLIVGGISWVMVRGALLPVERIRREADEITATELHRRLPEPRRLDEIGRLAATMNLMLARLDGSQQRQRRFVSDAAHELRSPIASIKQNVEVARSYPDHLSAGELVDTVYTESTRLEHLVAGLLALARLDEGVSSATAHAVDLDDVVFAEAARLRQATRLRIDTTAVSAGRVRADERALTQVVRNLVDNAEHHARRRIGLGLLEDHDWVTMIVDDDGPGIPEPERTRVFERFVRLDEARARDDGGSGLGLAIVHGIVAACGGEVFIGDSPFGGARVTVRLPRLHDH